MIKYLSPILKITVSAGIISFLCYQASSDKDFARILQTQKKWEYLLFGQIFVVGAISLSFIRWRSLVQAVGITFSLGDALRIGFIGHMFGCLSIGTFGSDAIRIYYVARENPMQKGSAIAAVFVDRICGLLGLFSLASASLIGFQMFGHLELLASESKMLNGITWTALGLTAFGLVGFGSLFVLPYIRRTRFVYRMVKIRFFGPMLEKMIEAGIAFQKRPSVLIIAFCQSLAVHVLLTLSVFCVAIGLQVPHPSLADHFVVSPIAHLASVLPLPGGLGGLEYALYFFYRAISNDPENSLGFLVALTYRITILIAAGLGIFFYVRGRSEIQSLAEHQACETVARENTKNLRSGDQTKT